MKTGAESVKQELKTQKGYWTISTINKKKQGAEKKPVEKK